MKLKYYLRGLGIGILLSTSILTIVFLYKTSDSQIIKKARELGMVMDENTEDKSIFDDDEETTTETKKHAVKDKDKEKETTKKKEEKTTTEKITKEEKTTEETTTEETTKEEKTTEEKTTKKPAEEKTTRKPEKEESTTKKSSEEETTKKTDKEKETKKEQEKETVYVNVKSGMYTEHVSSMMEDMGLIDSAADFNNYLVKNGYEDKLRTGSHPMIKGSSYEEMAKELTVNR